MAFNSQAQQQDSTLNLTLDQCLQYAYQHNPALQQTLLDKQITEQGIHSRLADWFPQINFDYNLQHNFQLQTSNIGGNLIQLGVRNTSAGQFSATQNIFNSDALLASSTAKTVRRQADQNITSAKIDLAVNVGKAFYDVLLTKEQLKVLDENITRLDRSLTDAYNQYEGGIVDKVDYKRATIALNNTKAQRKTANDVLKAKYAYLKLQMGVGDSVKLGLEYDSTKLAVLAVMERLSIMRGSATPMIVSLRITTKAETRSRPMTSRLRAAISCGRGTAGAASLGMSVMMDRLGREAGRNVSPPRTILVGRFRRPPQ